MSAQVEFYWAMERLMEGLRKGSGSLDTPVKTVTIDAEGRQRFGEELVIPAGGSASVYAYTTDGAWDFFVVQVKDGEGFLYWTATRDSPTSAENPAASGSHPDTTAKMGLSCTAPLVFSSRVCKVNSNATDGFVYGLTLYNPGADDVTVLIWSH